MESQVEKALMALIFVAAFGCLHYYAITRFGNGQWLLIPALLGANFFLTDRYANTSWKKICP